MDDLERAQELRRTSEEAPDVVDVDEVLGLVRSSDSEVRETALDGLQELGRTDGQKLAGRVDELAAFLEDDGLYEDLSRILVGVSLEAPLLVSESLVPYLADDELRDRAVSVLATALPMGPVPGVVLPYRDALLAAAATASSRGAALTVLASLADDHPEAVTEAVPLAEKALVADDESEEAPLRLFKNVARGDQAAVRTAVPTLRDHLRAAGYLPNPMLLDALYHVGLSYPETVEPVADQLRDLAEPVCPQDREPTHRAVPSRARNVLAVLEEGS